MAHVLVAAACAGRGARRAWTAPLDPVVTTAPFARLEAIGPDAWAVISTPLGGDRTTFANGGIVAGRSGVAVIEGFWRPEGAAWLARQARALTGRWPTHAIVTHYHIDHASGVAGYEADGAMPRLLATAPTRDGATSGGPVAPARSETLSRAFADVTVVPTDRETTLDLGGRALRLMPLSGHTRSDLAVLDEDRSIAFAGDLVWNGMFPNYVDATPPAWDASVARLASMLGDRRRARLVPGHGALVDAAAMARYRGLLSSVEEAARAGHAAGRSAAEAAASYRVPSSLGEWMPNAGAVGRAMTAWWRALEGGAAER